MDILYTQFREASEDPEPNNEEEQEPNPSKDPAKGKSIDSTKTTRVHMRPKRQAGESSDDDVQIDEEKSTKQKGKSKLSGMLNTSRRRSGLRSASKF